MSPPIGMEMVGEEALSTKTVMAEGSGMGSACVLMEMECHAMDTKVLRWAHLFQPVIPVEDELYNFYGDGNGISYPGFDQYDDDDPDRNGLGIGYGYGYLGYGGHVSSGTGRGTRGRANGNGRSNDGRC